MLCFLCHSLGTIPSISEQLNHHSPNASANDTGRNENKNIMAIFTLVRHEMISSHKHHYLTNMGMENRNGDGISSWLENKGMKLFLGD